MPWCDKPESNNLLVDSNFSSKFFDLLEKFGIHLFKIVTVITETLTV